MKKVLIALVILVLLGSAAWSQETERKPVGSICFLLGGAIVAPIGIGAEFFLGSAGIAVEVRGLFAAIEGTAAGTLEPGAYARFYFSELDSSLYVFGGASYLTVWDSEAGVVDAGILKPKAGLGYNAMFGRDNRTRFHVELGAVWLKPVIEGDLVGSESLLLPHLLLGFGRAF